jgi:hypothetical protein
LEGEYSANTIYMHVKGKIIPIETVSGMEEEGDKEK